jgi:methyltransferase
MGEVEFVQVWGYETSPYRPLVLLAAVVLPWLLLETWRSRRNEAALRAAGAIEPPDDVYAWMRIVYPGMFVAMTLEGLVHRLFWPPGFSVAGVWPGGPAVSGADVALAAGLAVFFAGKLLKWWAILSLGRFWSFHVLVLPGVPLVTSGPYRLMRHPNYVGLMGEIAGVALMMRAPFTGTGAAIVFGALLVARIRVEDRMLKGSR